VVGQVAKGKVYFQSSLIFTINHHSRNATHYQCSRLYSLKHVLTSEDHFHSSLTSCVKHVLYETDADLFQIQCSKPPHCLTLHNYWELLVFWQSQCNGFWWFGGWFFQDVDWRQRTYLAAMPSTFALPPSWSWSVAKFTKSLRTSNWSLAVHYIWQSPCNLWLAN
jgi:hypothetical protein